MIQKKKPIKLLEAVQKKQSGFFVYEPETISQNMDESRRNERISFLRWIIGIVISIVIAALFARDNIATTHSFILFIICSCIIGVILILCYWFHTRFIAPKPIVTDPDLVRADDIKFMGVMDKNPVAGNINYREQDRDVIVKKLHQQFNSTTRGPLILVGKSGMGKSVLIRLLKEHYNNQDAEMHILNDEHYYTQSVLAKQFITILGLDLNDDYKKLSNIARDVAGEEPDTQHIICFDQFEKILHTLKDKTNSYISGLASLISVLTKMQNIAVIISLRSDKFHEIFMNDLHEGDHLHPMVELYKGLNTELLPLGKIERKTEDDSLEDFKPSEGGSIKEYAQKIIKHSSTSLEQELALRFLSQEIQVKSHQRLHTLDDLKKIIDEKEIGKLIELYFERTLYRTGIYIDAVQMIYFISKFSIISGRPLKRSEIETAICAYRPAQKFALIYDAFRFERLIHVIDEEGDKDKQSNHYSIKPNGKIEISHDNIAERFVAYVDTQRILDAEVKASLDEYCENLSKKSDTDAPLRRPSESLEIKTGYESPKKILAFPVVLAVACAIFGALIVNHAFPYWYSGGMIHESEAIVRTFTIPLHFWNLTIDHRLFDILWAVLLLIATPFVGMLGFVYNWTVYWNMFAPWQKKQTQSLLPPLIVPFAIIIFFMRITVGDFLFFQTDSTNFFEPFSHLTNWILIVAVILLAVANRSKEKMIKAHLTSDDPISSPAYERISNHVKRANSPFKVGGWIVIVMMFIIKSIVFWQIATLLLVLAILSSYRHLYKTQLKKEYCLNLFAILNRPR